MNKHNLYIFVGMPKTGTTSLEKLFQTANADYYGKYNSSITKYISSIETSTKESERELSEITKQLMFKNVLLFDEAIIGNVSFSLENYRARAQRLKLLFPEAKIILFKRSKGYLKSLFNELTRFGDLHYWSYHNFEKAFNEGQTVIHKDILRHNDLERIYKELFLEVQVFNFDDYISDPHDLITHFSDLLGVTLPVTLPHDRSSVTNWVLTIALFGGLLINKLRLPITFRNKFFLWLNR